MMIRTCFAALLGASLLWACADHAGDPHKPEVDPDEAVLDIGKADQLTRFYATVVGDLATDGQLLDQRIGWPDWFHMRYLPLEAGQVVDVTVYARDLGTVRVYGPAHGVGFDGALRFRQAIAGAWVEPGAGVTLRVSAEEGGVYGVLFGPYAVWDTGYEIWTQCAEGCTPEDACEDAADCGAGEFCREGAACGLYGCDKDYDHCADRVGTNGRCTTSAGCLDGLPCVNNRCTDFGGGVRPGLGEACEAEDGCGAGFCGCAEDTCERRVCKAFAAEGGACEGFVRASDWVVCAPELSCLTPDFIADLRGNCGVSVTVQALLAEPERFDGRFVAVEVGAVGPGLVYCTQMACGPANPCCNSCGGSMLLADDAAALTEGRGVQLVEDGQAWGCGGDSCSYADRCTVTPGRYYIAGRVGFGEHGEVQLEVTRRFPAP